MTKKGIIYETLGTTAQMQIVESGNSGEMLLHGVFGVCGIKNGNNRIYEKSNYGKMVNILQEQMKTEAVLGELEHPNTMNITLENVSHKIEEITMNEDGTITGTIRLLDTPKGKIARAIIEGGCPLYISSRGAGSIDESGHVTLTMIKTYDLVGTPGFSQAKLTLKSGQKFESLNESLDTPAWMIVESEEEEKKDGAIKLDLTPSSSSNDKEDKNKDGDNTSSNNITMEDIKKSVDELTKKVEKLEAELHIAHEALDTVETALDEAQNNANAINYKAIQSWIEEEFTPVLKQEINERLNRRIERQTAGITKGVQEWVSEQLAPAIQNWTINEFGNAVQGWVSEEFAPVVEKWITEEYSGTLHDWITEEFAPETIKQITESVNSNVNDYLDNNVKDERYNAIDDVLEKLSKSVEDNTVAERILEQKQNDKFAGIPVVEGMPMNYRPMWAALSEDQQQMIIRESRMYDMTKPGAVEKFWSTRKLDADAITESRVKTPEQKPVNESRNNIFSQMKRLQSV